MNRDKIYMIPFIFLLYFACGNKSNELPVFYSYDETGSLKLKKIFHSNSDTTYYTILRYYSNGYLNMSQTFKSGDLNGDYLVFYEDGILFKDYSFRNGKFHGIQREYNSKGILKDEHFYIDGKSIVFKQFEKSDDGLNGRAIIYKNSGKDMIEIGRYIFNLESQEVDSVKSIYYHVFCPDTISFGNSVLIDIAFLYKRPEFQFELQLGELDSNLNFINPLNTEVLNTNSDTINYYFKANQRGTNLLMGKVYLKKDTLKIQLPFYHKVYVE